MLNLLIAIISDTFDRVVALNEHSSNYEKVHLILNIENLIDSKDRPDLGKYLLYAFCGNEIKEQRDLEEGNRIRSVVENLKEQ